MNVQLLLLLALAVPFCTFTHASPTEVPDVLITDTIADATTEAGVYTEVPHEDLTVVTGHPATDPPADHEEVATDALTPSAPPSVTVNTEEHVVETESPAPASTAAPLPHITEAHITEAHITEAHAVETAAPTDPAEVEVKPEVTGAAKEDTGDEVVVEDGTEEGLSSGQVVGIVIGALLAVVIVIAVVIAVVRRMGKYSSAKNKKPAKKDSIMVSPLRKKSAKQQERTKFWKF